jgi:hypothetical protein
MLCGQVNFALSIIRIITTIVTGERDGLWNKLAPCHLRVCCPIIFDSIRQIPA